MIEQLFPCPIGFYFLDRNITNKEMSYLKNLPMEKNTGNLNSCNGKVLSDKSMNSLNKFIRISLANFCEETFNFDADKITLKITHSWTNRTKQGEHHHKHSHPNSIISGVFYFDCNDNDNVQFYDTKNWLGLDKLLVPSKNFNPFNSGSCSFSVKVGELLLFPSQLEHAVHTVQGKKDRYSISFNTFYKGALGNDNANKLIL